jgi:hypothetical protein
MTTATANEVPCEDYGVRLFGWGLLGQWAQATRPARRHAHLAAVAAAQRQAG